MKKLKSLTKTISKMLLILVIGLYSAQPVQAQTMEWSGVCISKEDSKGEGGGVATIQGIECLIANVFTVIITLIGLASFVMFIVGSVQWMMSGGNAEGTKKARDTLTYAVIGIVVALSAFIVLNLVAGFTGVDDIKEFIIPTSDS